MAGDIYFMVCLVVSVTLFVLIFWFGHTLRSAGRLLEKSANTDALSKSLLDASAKKLKKAGTLSLLILFFHIFSMLATFFYTLKYLQDVLQ